MYETCRIISSFNEVWWTWMEDQEMIPAGSNDLCPWSQQSMKTRNTVHCSRWDTAICCMPAWHMNLNWKL